MPFDPEQHYRNCQDAVVRMTRIAGMARDVVVGKTADWDALKASLTAVGTGALSAFAEIRRDGREDAYNQDYLSMLRLASNLLGLEILELADDTVIDADDAFEMCRDYANAIRDPLKLGGFAELGIVPRHDRLRASSRPLLNRLGAVFGRALSAGELAPSV